jgi:hypothetical protein
MGDEIGNDVSADVRDRPRQLGEHASRDLKVAAPDIEVSVDIWMFIKKTNQKCLIRPGLIFAAAVARPKLCAIPVAPSALAVSLNKDGPQVSVSVILEQTGSDICSARIKQPRRQESLYYLSKFHLLIPHK